VDLRRLYHSILCLDVFNATIAFDSVESLDCSHTFCVAFNSDVLVLTQSAIGINFFSRAYFNESPVEVVKEQDKEINKLATDAIIPSMPGHVVQAFTLLKSSPEAQSVVASLASDRNVWDAVLKNEKVMEFYKTHQTTLVQTFPEEAATVESPEKFEDATSENAPTASPFADFVDNAKKTVMDVIDNITHFFQDLFGHPTEAQAGAGSSAEKGPSFGEMAVGGSFMALTIAVILVVLFKRA